METPNVNRRVRRVAPCCVWTEVSGGHHEAKGNSKSCDKHAYSNGPALYGAASQLFSREGLSSCTNRGANQCGSGETKQFQV